MMHATLVFLLDSAHPKRVLLGMKKRGFGKGKWNGFGGKPTGNETIEQTAVRELKEECGAEVAENDLQKMAVIDFVTPARPEWSQWVHVFVAGQWTGKPVETEEMKPEWFELEKIPFKEMWNDDQHWLPLVLNGKKLKARFVFGNDNEKITEFRITETERVK